MTLTHSEKQLLIQALEELSLGEYSEPNKIGKELDRKELIQKIRKIEPVNAKG